jgi:hypothetical protein
MSTAAPANVFAFKGTPGDVAEHQKAFNGRGRDIDGIPEVIEELSKKNQVAILSVGPWPQTIPCGSLGTKHVPACRQGEEYSDPLVLDGLTIEWYPLRENRMDILMHKDATGWNTAHQMIGVGPHLPPSNSKVKLGLFVTKGNPDFPPLSEKDAQNPEKRRWWLRERFKPTSEELKAAKKALNQHLNALVNEARSAAAQGQKTAEDTIRPQQHILAAQMLGLDPQAERWMQSAVPEVDRMTCKFCGKSTPKGFPKCQSCDEVLDRKLYEKLKAE